MFQNAESKSLVRFKEADEGVEYGGMSVEFVGRKADRDEVNVGQDLEGIGQEGFGYGSGGEPADGEHVSKAPEDQDIGKEGILEPRINPVSFLRLNLIPRRVLR